VTGLLADSESDFVTRVRELLLDDTLRRDLGAKAEMRTEQLTWASATETIRNALRA
jgi:hypothetical protein